MKRKILWLAVSCLRALSLVIAACGPAAAPTTPTTPTTLTAPTTPTKPEEEPTQKEAAKPTGEAPKYGGILTFDAGGDQSNWDPARNITGRIIGSIYQQLWEGDWAKGPAGGYGTNETDWGMGNNDLFDFKMGFIAESTKWTMDAVKNQGTIVYQIRQGVHWALNPNSEASRLVNGREMTTDDVLSSLKRSIDGSYPDAFIYRGNIELRTANVTKTGPWEIT